jgi:hypothetical protein
MANCWRTVCRHDYPGYSEVPCWRLDNITDNPVIDKPDYIPGELCQTGIWCYQADGNIPVRNWTTYCTPSTTPFQITSKSILDTPSSNARQWSTIGGLFLDRGIALACRFYPSTFCVPYIVFHYAYDRSSSAHPTIVEIREDDNGQPKGSLNPPDNNIIARVLITFPTNLYSFAVPVNAILNARNVPHWVVIYSDDYVCSSAYTGTSWRRVEFSPSSIGGNNLSIFSTAGATCSWSSPTTTTPPSISLATYMPQSLTCNGVIIIDDYGFAIDNQLIIDPCFKLLSEVQDKNVMIGIQYTAPRVFNIIRFDIAFRRADGTIYTSSQYVTGTQYGSNTVYLDTGEKYMPGANLYYDQLSINYAVTVV